MPQIDFRSYLVLEATLLKRLRKAWRPIAAAYHARITDAIKANDFASAYDAARHIDLTSIGEKNREFIKYLLLSCANFGAKVVTGNRDTVVGAGNHEDLLNKVTDSLIYAIENNLSMEMTISALKQIAAADPNRQAFKSNPNHEPAGSSKGGEFAKSATSTPEFKAWFGGSKVVDSKGNPLKVFHGTKADFDNFHTTYGAYFTNNPEIADVYNGTTFSYGSIPSKGATYPVYLSMNNPKVVDAKGSSWTDINGKSTNDIVTEVKESGLHDGVHFKNVRDGGFTNTDVYVVFSPGQIKSAISNNGKFDPKDPNITKSEALKLEPDQYVGDFVSFSKDGDALLQLIASQHTSRLATWGFAAEAEVLGVTKYRVTAVLDGRTSKFCRMMNGHIFEVQDARRTVNQVLGLDNPDDIKNVQPWPSQSKASIKDFSEMSAAELTALNLHIPPYHPNCRTLLTIVKESPRLQKPEALAQQVNDQAPLMSQYTATEDTFKEMGVNLDPDAVKHWNDYVGLNPVEVYSKLSGLDQATILAGALTGNYRKLVVDATGNFKIMLQQIVGQGEATLNMVYDPYNGSLYQNYLTISDASSPEAATYLSAVYSGMMDVAQSIDAQTLHIASSGASSAKMYAQAGFLPSPVDWFKIKDDLLSRIDSGDLSTLKDEMDPDYYQTVVDILNSKDEQGFYALNALPATVGPLSLSEVLFKDLNVDLMLDTSDPNAVANAKDALK